MDLYHDEYSTYYHYNLPDIDWNIKYPSDDEEKHNYFISPASVSKARTTTTNFVEETLTEVIELAASDDEEEDPLAIGQASKRQKLYYETNGYGSNEENGLVIDEAEYYDEIEYETVGYEVQNGEYDYENDGQMLNYELTYEIETADGSCEDDYKGETLENKSGTYRCPMCPKEVVSKYNLKRHMMIHTGEKPYPCDVCNKGFRELSDLRKHRKVHEEGTKLFECTACFRSYKSFKTNRCYFCEGEEDEDMPPPTTYEDPNKLYQCFLCNKTQLTTFELKKHLRCDHPATSRTPWNPNGVGNVSSNMDSLESMYTCNICTKTFRNKQFLMLHALTHANNRVERVS